MIEKEQNYDEYLLETIDEVSTKCKKNKNKNIISIMLLFFILLQR